MIEGLSVVEPRDRSGGDAVALSEIKERQVGTFFERFKTSVG